MVSSNLVECFGNSVTLYESGAQHCYLKKFPRVDPQRDHETKKGTVQGQPLVENVEIITSVGRIAANIPFETRHLTLSQKEMSGDVCLENICDRRIRPGTQDTRAM